MVYFLYSEDQIKEKNNILSKCGKQFVPGVVTIQGKRQNFTQISNKPSIDRFIDTKIVASFPELKGATYVAPSTRGKTGE